MRAVTIDAEDDVSDFRGSAGSNGQGFLREIGQRLLGRYIEDGFGQAAEICLGVMQIRMDELQAKASLGKMTQADQVLWSKLEELKVEMESHLRQHAEGGDWWPR